MHLEGNRQTNNKILAYEMFAEREKLTAYVSKPVLICDLPCEYDYFTVLLCGESIFYNNKENVYLYVGNKNTIIHFEEVFVDNYSVWGKKNNILYLVSVGEIQYSEPFTKFRFTAIQRGSFCSYVDYENYDKLMWIERIKKYKLIKQNQHLVNNPPKVLCFNDKKIEFEYYSEKCNLCFNGRSSRINYNIELLGIREREGEHIRIMLAFAHTLQYVGLNRFIANCEDGKFSLIEIIYCGQVGNGDDGVENLYDIPNYILYGYDYVNRIGDGYYEFIKEGQKVVIYNANDGSIKDTF